MSSLLRVRRKQRALPIRSRTPRFLLAISLLGWSLLSGAGAQAQHDVVAIEGVRLFDGDQAVEDATVVFSNEKILTVGPSDVVEVPADAERIDGQGHTLLPGLIDGHTHTWGNALAQALDFGVTTQLDMFTEPGFAASQRAEQAAGAVPGRADLVSAGVLVTAPGGHGTQFGIEIPTLARAEDAAAFVTARLAEGSDFIKVVLEDGTAAGRRIPGLDDETARAVITAAHALGALVVAHVSTSEKARLALEAGIDGLVHVYYDRPPTSEDEDAELVELARRSGAFLMPTMTVIHSAIGLQPGARLLEDDRLTRHLPADQRGALNASFARRSTKEEQQRTVERIRQRIRAYHDGGVEVLAGTDAPNPGTAYGVSMHQEIEFLVEAGLSTTDALAAATSRPAQRFGLDDRGRVAPGLRADLLLVEGNPLDDITDSRNIVAIWKAGRRHQRQTFAAIPSLPQREPGVISNFDEGDLAARFGSWAPSTDRISGGKSSVELDWIADGQGAALRVTGAIREGFAFPWAGPMFMAGDAPMEAVDLLPANSIRFRARGAGPLRVLLFAQSLGMVPREQEVQLEDQWQEYSLQLSLFGADASDLIGVVFSGKNAGAFAFDLDDFAIE